MKKTKKQQALEFLKARGWVEKPNSRTFRYLELMKPGVDYYYYLGSAGAVRRGKTAGRSISVKLKMGEAAPTPTPPTDPYLEGILNHKTPEALTELVETDALTETLVEDENSSDPIVPAVTEPTDQPAMTGTQEDTSEDEQCSDPTTDALCLDQKDSVTSAAASTTQASAQVSNETTLTSTNLGLAGRIAAMRQTREVGQPVAGMVPNAEQESILEVASDSGLRVLVVGAGAGTGKTATLKMLEQVLPGKIQYTAFNSALVAESKTKFTKAECNTTHSLAFRAVGYKYKHRLGGERIKSYQVARMMGISSFNVVLPGMGEPDAEGKHGDKLKVLQPDFLAGQVTVALRKFCQSADREIGAQHFAHIAGIDAVEDGHRTTDNNAKVREYLVPIARKAWRDITDVNGELPFNHDCYVKIWQLGEGNNRPVIAADYILLDEAQDTAPVFLDILKQQKHATLILVGDDNQQIYEWRGAVNAMSSFRGAPRRMLSQSYRFGQAVADVANAVLGTLEEPTDLVMRGLPTIPSRVDEVASPRCFIYRTNAGAVSRVMQETDAGRRPHLIGGGDDVVRWCEAAMELQAKRGTRHPELCCFEDWKEVEEYSETDEGADMALMVKLVNKFGAQRIRDALRNMPEEKDADLVVTTAHRSKGREWTSVKLGPDFPLANRMQDSDRRLLYVAGTRAKLTLDIRECPPFCGGMEGKGDDARFIPGIEIRYTAQMPTEEEVAGFHAANQSPTIAPVPSNGAVKADPPAGDDRANTANVAKPNGNGSGIPTNIFTWAKGFDGKWNVRGPKDAKPGDQVKVIKRNGQASIETIREVLKRYDDAWVYGV